MPKPKLKTVPTFRSEDEERAFWATADSTEYVDWSKARRVTFPNLKPSTTTISLRLPDMLLAELRTLANERDVPYQSLLKVYLAERIADERQDMRQQPNKRLQPSSARRRASTRTKAKSTPRTRS
ncbi:MAG: BrnA antitoxin family protein [Gemmatimonadales bacterium]